MFKVNVPVPPTTNNCYFYVKGRKIKKPIATNYEDVTRQIIKNAIASHELLLNKKNIIYNHHSEKYFFDTDKKIVCDMIYYFSDARCRDTHNTFKILFDVLEEAGLYKNDRYLLPRVIDWDVDRENPRVELHFYYL